MTLKWGEGVENTLKLLLICYRVHIFVHALLHVVMTIGQPLFEESESMDFEFFRTQL